MRNLSAKAHTVYSETDPLDIYKTGDDTFSIRGGLGDVDGMTFAEIETMLESLMSVRKYWKFSNGTAYEISEEEANNSIEIPYEQYEVIYNPSLDKQMSFNTGDKFIGYYDNEGEGSDYYIYTVTKGLDRFDKFEASSEQLDFFEYSDETEDGIVFEGSVPLGFGFYHC